ncbi:hypothetical protein [Streptomyces sp. H27-C3]|uniref:hypothetical protein n=1 Tax=Streptomyces sp. H27-C3 TaxID=3046305 RepID=UPI0024B9F09C|nr:hypothetical protein [Streptomyces sp. H27-C3]MDJ0463655.1 hypothetical protein [Streptomyces sp. H27-C3]
MRSIGALRVASTALLGVAALSFAVPMAVAEDGNNNITSFGFTVTPSTIAAGGTVTLNATECQVPTVKVMAPVFDDVTLKEGKPGTAQVYPDAKPGAQYDVTFECKGEKGTTTLTIAGGDQHTNTSTGTRTGDVHKGVKAGAGGSFSDADPLQIAAGSAVLAGALGFGVYLRRRRSGNAGDSA